MRSIIPSFRRSIVSKESGFSDVVSRPVTSDCGRIGARWGRAQPQRWNHGSNHGLRRQLGLRDLVLSQVLCVVGASWVGVAAGLGRGQAVTWAAAMLLFYLPVGAVVIGLNRIMPLEGGLYVWAHEGFGRMMGFLTAWNLWVYGIAIVAAILYAIPTELAYMIGPRASWLPESHWASLTIVGSIVVAITLAAVRGTGMGQVDSQHRRDGDDDGVHWADFFAGVGDVASCGTAQCGWATNKLRGAVCVGVAAAEFIFAGVIWADAGGRAERA